MYKTNSIIINYYNSYDLLNKYNFSQLKKQPKINKIILYFSWNNIKSNSNIFIKKNNPNLQIKSILFFYLFLAKNSKINYKKSLTSFENNYGLKIILNYPIITNFFFENLFIENLSRINDGKKKIPLFYKKNIATINSFLKGNFFFVNEYLFANIFYNLKLNSFIIKKSLILKNSYKFNNICPNLYLGWAKN